LREEGVYTGVRGFSGQSAVVVCVHAWSPWGDGGGPGGARGGARAPAPRTSDLQRFPSP
jgi:hypothetical protein